MQLEGKTVLITGAGSGIGRAVAVACARRQMKLVLVGRRSQPLEQTAREANAAGALLLPADVSDARDRQRIFEAVGSAFGRLDVLVNNAGVSSVGLLEDLSETAIAQMVAVNLLGPMLLTRLMLPLLGEATPGSRIVNVGSIFGDIAYPMFAPYSATKFGLRGFSDAMRRELKATGIGVSYVAPRATRTAAMEHYEDLVEPFSMTVDTVEVAAAQVMRALSRDLRSSYAQGMERIFVMVQRLAPALIDRGVHAQIRRARQTSRQRAAE